MGDDSSIVEPDIGEDATSDELEARQAKAELKLLESDARLKVLSNSEMLQRILLKWLAVGIAIIVIIGMACLMVHLLHRVFWGPFSFAGTTFKVAMIVAPIASITTITVSLLVGAFRKFDDKDIESLQKGISTGRGMWPSDN